MYSREACRDTQTSIRLASHLVIERLTPDLEDMNSNPLCGGNSVHCTVQKPAETQTSSQLARHLVRVPNSRSEGHEFVSPVRRELGALTKSGKNLGARSFYNHVF
jgi:hypothetical protein